MKYYAVIVHSNYESKVKLALLENIKNANAEDMFGEILLPTETVQQVVRGKKRIAERKFFPGYLFVEMELNDTSWHIVKDTNKVSNFVGNQSPTPVSPVEIANIKNRMQQSGEAPKAVVHFDEGDTVKVIDGAFGGFNGTVEAVKPDKQKVVVLVSIFGRATPVELGYTQVEKLSS
ncbi:MAG: transcription termination/antitermination protein NusG [Deltaproteobacteria bacterium]|nr:transcription termination/antitermination protein NusG [Deltaproteobacteria bacterium]